MHNSKSLRSVSDSESCIANAQSRIDMKTLITPLQVLKIAFGDGETLPPEAIAQADIAAAEERWIVPAIGRKLYDKLADGAHADFSADFLAAPIAFFTRTLIQPRLDVRTDRTGTAAPRSSYGQPADDTALRLLRRRLLQEARTLLHRATEQLRTHPSDFPEYDPDGDSTARCSIESGLILPDHGTRTR